MRILRRVTVFAAILCLVAIAAVWYFLVPALILYPVRGGAPDIFGHKPPPGVTLEPMKLKTPDGVALEGFSMTPKGSARSRPTVILLHGICNSKDGYENFARTLCAEGFRVVAFDSRGHGRSGGCATYGWNEKKDVSRIIDEIKRKDPGSRIGIYGNSMGGAIALQAMAADGRIECGVIESTFASFDDAVGLQVATVTKLRLDPLLYPGIWFAGTKGGWNPFEVRPEKAARSITRPVMLAHGTADELFPISQGERIFKSLASPAKEWVPVAGGRHNGLWEAYGPGYGNRISGFLKKWLN